MTTWPTYEPDPRQKPTGEGEPASASSFPLYETPTWDAADVDEDAGPPQVMSIPVVEKSFFGLLQSTTTASVSISGRAIEYRSPDGRRQMLLKSEGVTLELVPGERLTQVDALRSIPLEGVNPDALLAMLAEHGWVVQPS